MNHKVNVHSNWNEVRKGEGSNRKEVLKLPKDCQGLDGSQMSKSEMQHHPKSWGKTTTKSLS